MGSKETIIPPTLLAFTTHDGASPATLELSLHTPPRAILAEFEHIFPDNIPSPPSAVFVLPTIQPSLVGSLLKYDAPIAAEKDRLLELFFAFVTTHLLPTLPDDVFLDYLDPCSGLPMIAKSNHIYDGECRGRRKGGRTIERILFGVMFFAPVKKNVLMRRTC